MYICVRVRVRAHGGHAFTVQPQDPLNRELLRDLAQDGQVHDILKSLLSLNMLFYAIPMSPEKKMFCSICSLKHSETNDLDTSCQDWGVTLENPEETFKSMDKDESGQMLGR